MEKTLLIKTDRWYKVMLVWELYRIPYNILMVVSGIIGIAILNVSIPIVYLLIGLLFNILYTILFAIDLIIKHRGNTDKSIKIFLSYYVLSSLLVIGLPAVGIILLWLRS